MALVRHLELCKRSERTLCGAGMLRAWSPPARHRSRPRADFRLIFERCVAASPNWPFAAGARSEACERRQFGPFCRSPHLLDLCRDCEGHRRSGGDLSFIAQATNDSNAPQSLFAHPKGPYGLDHDDWPVADLLLKVGVKKPSQKWPFMHRAAITQHKPPQQDYIPHHAQFGSATRSRHVR